eukprot:3397206-Pleurochrysis_carterae.AAC.1
MRERNPGGFQATGAQSASALGPKARLLTLTHGGTDVPKFGSPNLDARRPISTQDLPVSDFCPLYAQAALIRSLRAARPDGQIAVGLEAVQRKFQPALDE